ncbi:hypothetical protein, partial [Cysteiniphilum litorale]|uniref:hypothetical protein n=1 Tax=Cysteiniphilum litorale TaxID=2056700 RepID=UPI003F883B1C
SKGGYFGSVGKDVFDQMANESLSNLTTEDRGQMTGSVLSSSGMTQGSSNASKGGYFGSVGKDVFDQMANESLSNLMTEDRGQMTDSVLSSSGMTWGSTTASTADDIVNSLVGDYMGRALDPNSYASTATAVSVNFKTDAANDSFINNYGANLATQPLTNFEAIANTKGFQKVGQSVSNTIADLLGQGRASVNGSFKLPGWVGVAEAATASAVDNNFSNPTKIAADTAVALLEGVMTLPVYGAGFILGGGPIGGVLAQTAAVTTIDNWWGDQMRESSYSILNQIVHPSAKHVGSNHMAKATN